MRRGEAREQDDEEPPAQGARQVHKPADSGGQDHGRAVTISTGMART
jgi:hypothetical protein